MSENDFDISTLASLAKIELSENEEKNLKDNLSKIVHYMESLNTVDTEGIPPCSSTLRKDEGASVEDRLQEPLDRETFLANSPSQVGGMIRVPPIIQF